MRKINSVLEKIVLLVAFLVLSSFTGPKLMKITVAEGITARVPKDWRPMDDFDFRERYPSVRAPLAAYTNADRLVDFSINVSATQWPDGDAALAHEFFKASLYNFFDRVDIISEGVREINGKKFIYLEFESTVTGSKQNMEYRESIMNYNYLQYLVEPKRTLSFSFHCPRRLRQEWQDTAHEMMDAIKVK